MGSTDRIRTEPPVISGAGACCVLTMRGVGPVTGTAGAVIGLIRDN
jgi:hypothetical protein